MASEPVSKPSTSKLKVIYKSPNFIVVDKDYDIKINSDDEEDTVTVATQLAHNFPEFVDQTISYKFRFVSYLNLDII